MLSDLETKLKTLREKYSFQEDKDMVRNWEIKLQEANVLKDLKDLDGIKLLLIEIEKIIKEITTLLAWDKNQTDEQRKLLFTRRDVYLWFVGFFENPEKIINNIQKQVENELIN